MKSRKQNSTVHLEGRITATEIIRVSVEGQRELAALLIHPPAPGPALKRAFRRRRELPGAGTLRHNGD